MSRQSPAYILAILGRLAPCLDAYAQTGQQAYASVRTYLQASRVSCARERSGGTRNTPNGCLGRTGIKNIGNKRKLMSKDTYKYQFNTVLITFPNIHDDFRLYLIGFNKNRSTKCFWFLFVDFASLFPSKKPVTNIYCRFFEF